MIELCSPDKLEVVSRLVLFRFFFLEPVNILYIKKSNYIMVPILKTNFLK